MTVLSIARNLSNLAQNRTKQMKQWVCFNYCLQHNIIVFSQCFQLYQIHVSSICCSDSYIKLKPLKQSKKKIRQVRPLILTTKRNSNKDENTGLVRQLTLGLILKFNRGPFHLKAYNPYAPRSLHPKVWGVFITTRI